MMKFDEIEIGQKAVIEHRITLEDIQKFVDLTGDDNKLHVDDEFASRTTFKKPVVHGMLGASFISTIIGTRLPGDGALWYSQKLDFLLPVRVGDLIKIQAEVIKKHDKSSSIELSTDIYNQNKEKVTSGLAHVKLIQQEDEPKNIKKKEKEKVAIVIGGSGGIGEATCYRLSKDNYNIIIHYNSNKKAAMKVRDHILKLGGNAICLRADITKIDEISLLVETTLRKFGSITALINCSTPPLPNIKFKDLEWVEIQNQINVNVMGAFNVCKSVVPVMVNQGYGKIVHITSQAIEQVKGDWIHYITAKSALHGLTKSLAFELAPNGINVNLVSPGLTDTGLVANMPEKSKKLTAAKSPLRRIANTEDVANSISYLCSENANYLSGETIRINGGQVMI